MKNFKDYRNIKSQLGYITEQEFMTDKSPENLEVEIVDSGDSPIGTAKVPLKKIEGPDEDPMGDSHVDSLMTKLVNFQLQVRIFHWNTREYPPHMAAGTTYTDLDAILDTLVETYQGHNDRIKFTDTISIRNIEDLVIEEWLQDTMETMDALRSKLPQSDLQNIMDEALGTVSKFKYLLTLK